MHATRKILSIVAFASLLTGTAVAAEKVTGLQPANPQPSADQLAPGLGVKYWFTFIRDVGDIAAASDSDFENGEPLPNLNYHPPRDGAVMTAGKAMGVASRIRGFIKFDKAGEYNFKVTSNDGFTMDIGGQFIYANPYVHSDETSELLPVEVPSPGWYPIAIDYFQRKGTATLELSWTAPGGNETIVPPEAFAHMK